MAKTRYHMRLNITGGIKNAQAWCDCITVDGKLLHTEKEVKTFLREQLAMGRRVLPLGDCDNFDYQTGCRGHVLEDEQE